MGEGSDPESEESYSEDFDNHNEEMSSEGSGEDTTEDGDHDGDNGSEEGEEYQSCARKRANPDFRPTLLHFSPEIVQPLREAKEAAQLANSMHMQRLQTARGDVQDGVLIARQESMRDVEETKEFVIRMAEQASFIHDTLLRELEAALTVASAVSDSAADALLWDDVRRQARSASVAHYSLRDEAVAWCAGASSVEGAAGGFGVAAFTHNMEGLVARVEGVMEEVIQWFLLLLLLWRPLTPISTQTELGSALYFSRREGNPTPYTSRREGP